MAFKVVATPFGRRLATGYPHEHEALRPLGVEITTINASTDDEWIAQAQDADAVILGGRRMTADLIGLVAFGNIPRLVARKAKGFDMRVLAWDPFVPDEAFKQHGVERVADLKELFRRSDFVSAHLPYNPQTKGLLSYELFSVMK